MSLIPATILTGFLGSGKTTLLKRVLTEAHGQKIAVIENEFGEENIDSEILVQDSKEQIIQLNNGCVCCTIREDLRTTLADLAEKKRKGEIDFDRVVIETTGLADPGPVAQTFFMDDEIAETYLLDSILTLVDAKHADQQLDSRQEARRQIGFADQIFISKTDLVDDKTVEALIHRVKHMNPRAPQTRVNFGEVPIKDVFDLKGFNLNAKLDIDPDFLKADEHEHGHDDPGHAEHACRAALAIADIFAADNRRRAKKGFRPVRLRIGIHTGPAVVGNVGAPGRINYTLIGDTVNAAQRIEQLGKEVKTEADVIVLASAATLAELPADIAREPLGELLLRGMGEFEVFRLG